MERKVFIYDTTLRDGTQGEEVSFSVDDKLAIAKKLDELGIDYIEGGWPASNPKDKMFFEKAKELKLSHSKIVAFGSTIRPGFSPEEDYNIQSLVSSGTEVVTVFGKTWDIHVTEALGISLDDNLDLIRRTITYLKSKGKSVFFDAEHFFDGFKKNKPYTLSCIKEAASSGADVVVLCDTNGGCLPFEIEEIVREVKEHFPKVALGIHVHNDSETAVANSIVAVRAGVEHVQGTINGYGERCGNANLCSIIPNLQIKMGYHCIPDESLKKLTEISRFVDEMANLPHNKHLPYVGDSAFAHKGGVHVSAILKNPKTYEHIEPEAVGNKRRVLVSDLSGGSNIIYKAKELGIELDPYDEATSKVLNEIKELENRGYQFEGAEASFEILLKKALNMYTPFFRLMGYRVIVEKRAGDKEPLSEATLMIKVDTEREHTASMGNGPVNAIDHALRKALERFYPQLKEVKLIDYKVRILSSDRGTGTKVRVLVTSTDGKMEWRTVGVSENIIQASYKALVDSFEYKLMKDKGL